MRLTLSKWGAPEKSIALSNIEKALLFLWVLLMVSPALKIELFPRIEWLVTITLLPYLCIQTWKRKSYFIDYRYLFYSGLLVAAVFISTIFSAYKIYTAAEGIKLLIIFSTLPLLASHKEYLHTAWKALIAAALINFLLLMTAFYHTSILASIYGFSSRWETILARPGQLSKLGLVVYICSFYVLLNSNKKLILNCGLIFIGLVIIFLDGARLALLSALLGFSLITLITAWGNRFQFTWTLTAKLLGIILLFILAFYFSAFTSENIVKNNKQTWITIHHPLTLAILSADRDKYYTKVMKHNSKITQKHKRLSHFVTPSRLYSTIDTLHSLPHSRNLLKSIDPIRYQQYIAAFAILKKELKNSNHLKSLARLIFGAGMNGLLVPIESSLINEKLYMDVANNYLAILGKAGIFGLLGLLLLTLGWLTSLPSTIRKLAKLHELNDKAMLAASLFFLFYFIFYCLTSEFSTEFSEWIFYLLPMGVYLRFITTGLEPEKRGNPSHE